MLRNSELQKYITAVNEGTWHDDSQLVQGIRKFATVVENMEQEIATKDDKIGQMDVQLKIANQDKSAYRDTVDRLNTQVIEREKNQVEVLQDIKLVTDLVVSRIRAYFPDGAGELAALIQDIVEDRLHRADGNYIPF